MNRLKALPKLLIYGPILNYHLNQRKKIDTQSLTASKYHLEMSEHYYRKIYGCSPKDKITP